MKVKQIAYFPMFIPLEQEKIVVVGAGKIAERRIRTLLPFGADIIVIAPEVSDEIFTWYQQKKLYWIARAYQKDDVKEARMVIAATNQRIVNHQVFEACEMWKIPVSVADCKEESSFYFPAVIQQGTSVIGVTASGTDHKLAKRIADNIRSMKQMLFSEK